MNIRSNLRRLLPALLICCFWLPATVQALVVPPRPTNYVVDQANLIDGAIEQQINGYLRELEQKTTAQMVVLTVPSLEGENLEDISLSIAHDQWKLGQQGKDNGVLLLVSAGDHQYRFEIGYGLEGVLPDSFVGSLGRTYLVPLFRQGEFGKGIYAAVLATAREIATDAGVTITGMPKLRHHPGQQAPARRKQSLFSKIISLFFFVMMGILFIRNPRLFLMLLLFSSMGGRRGSWGGGGSFGGGGFGGGGGGFGGGGASGSW
ncbi:MAG: TPM domain-containing protein [Deltaproteobacteria bacterium]|nr:TPM domain-containing protein [Candidatus Anaeroferrophillus wilburensis]MBN2887954.1 TPM domain-containing protein [Deltaproteobacteria bacterium]